MFLIIFVAIACYQILIACRAVSCRVVIDNDSCHNATVIRVDRVKKHGILLEAVQVLVDLDLVITKAYISSDCNWFMDVFNVTDQDGSKLQNKEVIDHIQKCLESENYLVSPAAGPTNGVAPPSDDQSSTSIELTGTDRPGLLSEVCAVLASLSCNIVKAEVWTHDRRAAAVIQITDEATGLAIHDAGRLSMVQELLGTVMQGDGRAQKCCSTCTDMSVVGASRAERRLHKMMLDDDDDNAGEDRCGKARPRAGAKVVVMDCTERQYTVVILRCRDRPKLLFDTLCALTDLHYVVFHGTVDAEPRSKEAYQEYYVRHVDGHPVRSDDERSRLVRCLEAAVERRATNGLELEVRTEDRVGLLSEITRVFRENSLSIIRAAISTRDGMAEDTFHVSDAYGHPVDGRTMDAVGDHLGHAVLRVKRSGGHGAPAKSVAEGGAVSVLGSLLKGSFQGLRLIRSYS
ncbi:hypothetical protein HU200_061953 [Digitaria exilis]|uniref:ACT domain-containing protein ACR n=1 Tax=Digitaria exilis TaxID=1010633 RepID=A0A835A3Q1_9POAL|nr:hypothetical protein HU200_061953 [Digitaria exilis]